MAVYIFSRHQLSEHVESQVLEQAKGITYCGLPEKLTSHKRITYHKNEQELCLSFSSFKKKCFDDLTTAELPNLSLVSGNKTKININRFNMFWMLVRDGSAVDYADIFLELVRYRDRIYGYELYDEFKPSEL